MLASLSGQRHSYSYIAPLRIDAVARESHGCGRRGSSFPRQDLPGAAASPAKRRTTLAPLKELGPFSLENRLASSAHRTPASAKVPEDKLAFPIAKRSAALTAYQRKFLPGEGEFDAHHLVFRLAGRTSKLGHIHGARS